MKRCVILSACPVSAFLRNYLREGDTVIACDAGYRNAEILDVTPDLIVGDFDSAPRPAGEDVIVLPHMKDDTDTQYAANLALEKGARQVIMLGALGGKRLEHTLANLATGLYLTKRGADVLLADENSEIRYLAPGRRLSLQRQEWAYFSVFPLEGGLTGLEIDGALYPLKNAALAADYPLGVSNEFKNDRVELFCAVGYGVVVLTRKD